MTGDAEDPGGAEPAENREFSPDLDLDSADAADHRVGGGDLVGVRVGQALPDQDAGMLRSIVRVSVSCSRKPSAFSCCRDKSVANVQRHRELRDSQQEGNDEDRHENELDDSRARLLTVTDR